MHCLIRIAISLNSERIPAGIDRLISSKWLSITSTASIPNISTDWVRNNLHFVSDEDVVSRHRIGVRENGGGQHPTRLVLQRTLENEVPLRAVRLSASR